MTRFGSRLCAIDRGHDRRERARVRRSRYNRRMPSRDQIESLLYDLCVTYGFCLPPEDNERLVNEPPGTVDAFTDAVYRAEGMDPFEATPRARQLREKVRARVAETFLSESRPS
jgi:hypothetical protein